MKKVLLAAAAVIALPAIAQAQDVQTPGVYFGVEGGLNWLFGTTILGQYNSPYTGWAAGGKIVLFGNGGSAADAQHIAAELTFVSLSTGRL